MTQRGFDLAMEAFTDRHSAVLVWVEGYAVLHQRRRLRWWHLRRTRVATNKVVVSPKQHDVLRFDRPASVVTGTAAGHTWDPADLFAGLPDDVTMVHIHTVVIADTGSNPLFFTDLARVSTVRRDDESFTTSPVKIEWS